MIYQFYIGHIYVTTELLIKTTPELEIFIKFLVFYTPTHVKYVGYFLKHSKSLRKINFSLQWLIAADYRKGSKPIRLIVLSH